MNAQLRFTTRAQRALKRSPRRALRPVALAAACLMAGSTLQAADIGKVQWPAGLQIVAGQASVAANGTRMTVTNSNNAILNWTSFSIGQGNSVNFAQPNSTSQVLNRVVGSDPSNILGSLSSNGRVWLLNPYGVLFGQNARVDVAGLVASTLNIGDADWQARRYSLLPLATPVNNAAVVNQGELRTSGGGRVVLIGAAGGVRNEGLIDTSGGQVVLAAGSSVELVDTALPNLSVRVSAPQGEALNLGQIVSAGGRIDLLAAVVNQQGIVRADAIGSGQGGTVMLTGSAAVDTSANSRTSADGASGGSVNIDAGAAGTALLSGRISASGAQGLGGTVTLLGQKIGLLAAGVVDVSGSNGGGAAFVGGGAQGRDAGLRNAGALYFDAQAAINADALQRGNGGRIVLWSDHATRAYGSLSARGGAGGGDGGFIETSGGWLDARPLAVRTSAAAGRAGQWLLDPDNIVITDNGTDIGISGGPDFSSNSDPALLSSQTIVAALDAGNNVSVTTGHGGSSAGDISVSSANIKPVPSAPVSLTLNAGRNISFDFSTVRSDGAPLSLTLNAGYEGAGAIAIRSSSIITRGGDITLGGPSTPCGPNACGLINTAGAVATDNTGLRDGIAIASSTLDAGSGAIRMVGHSTASLGDANGVIISEGSTLSARTINITGTVDADGDFYRTGVKLAGGPLAATQGIFIDGQAYSGVYQQDAYPTGVDVLSELQVDPGSFNNEVGISIQGSVQEAARVLQPFVPPVQRFGVGIRGGAGTLTVANGAFINVQGVDDSPNGDWGILATGTAANFINASGGSSLMLNATGGIRLTGQVLAPENGTLQLISDSLLSIDSASITGNAGHVSLQGETVEIGLSGESAQLVFGSSTDVQVDANNLRLGVVTAAPPPNPPLGAQGSSRMHALGTSTGPQLNPPASQTLIASGGPIDVFADSIEIGIGATLHSEAAGSAITLNGASSSGTNIGNFVNTGGAGVLSTPNGRWLIYAIDPDDSVGSPFVPGGLSNDFRQYGAAAGATPLGSGNGFLFSVQPTLSVSGGGPLDRVYDGTANFDPNFFDVSVIGLKNGDKLLGGLQYNDKNAGSKTIGVVPAGATGIVDTNGAPVYGYLLDGARLVGNITPRSLDLAGISVADKAYDGNSNANVSQWNFSGLVPGDQVRQGSTSASFADPNVGQAKTVSASVSSLAGADAGNYTLSENNSASATASILPATLFYVADPKSINQGAALPAFTGSVSGFVAQETQASATTGTLAFNTTVTDSTNAGRFAINGSGLTAQNYVFVQAGSNATALNIVAPPPPPVEVVPQAAVTTALAAAITLVALPSQASSAQAGRALDAMQAVQPGASGGKAAFASLDLSNMSQDSVAAVLAARDQYKKTIFAQALNKLEQNPGLADAQGCATSEQAASGLCLMIAPLGSAEAAALSNGRLVERAAATAAPQPTPAPAPPGMSTAASPTAAAAAPARPATAPGAADAALAALPEVTLRLPAPRAVRQASVPQIVRKLAVVIGIDQYSDERIPKLGNAVGDAKAIAAALENELGYQTVVLQNPTRTSIFRTLNQLSSALGPDDSVVLYYAGHGELVEKTGLGYWQPADADADRPETWISNTDIQRLLRQLPARQVAMISDSCFSGSLVTDERIRGTQTQDAAALLSRRATVVMSSGGNEPVFDSGKDGHSPFASSLLQSLAKVSTWKPGSSIFEQVRFDVARQLPQRPQYGASRAGGHEAGADYLFEERKLEGVTR